MEPVKVLYLDIDGVLNDQAWIGSAERLKRLESWALEHNVSRWRAMIEQPAMDIRAEYTVRVKRIVDATGCQVVLCSSWRRLHDFDNLRLLLGAHGIPLDGATARGPERGPAIARHVRRLPPGSTWCALDDEVSDEWARSVGGRAVQPVDGCTDEDAAAVVAILGAR